MSPEIPVAVSRRMDVPQSADQVEAVTPAIQEGPGLAAMPAALRPGVCIWLTSGRPGLPRQIGPALCERLRAQLREVEFLPRNATGEPAEPRLDPSDAVSLLADGAASLVRHGVTVVVAHPLIEAVDRALVKDRVERVVEVYIRSAAGPLRGPEGIPVIYRWMSEGRIEERVMPSRASANGDRPDVIVDGSLGPPSEAAGDILDVLERAGWIPPGGPEAPPPRSATRPETLAALPSVRR